MCVFPIAGDGSATSLSFGWLVWREEEEEETEEIIDQMAVDDEQERDDNRASALKGGATEYKGK